MSAASETKTTNSYRFYTAPEYRHNLVELINKTGPGDRLLLMSMTFDPTEPEIAAIMRATEAAVSRGVNVNVAVDAHSFLVRPDHFPSQVWPRIGMPSAKSAYFQNKLRIIEKINSYETGHADILNLPTRRITIPISGRSHIKAAIINDHIFLGGCNLEGSSNVDMMVGWRSKSNADMLHALLCQVIHGKYTRRALAELDRALRIDDQTNIFIDSGKRNQSKIFAEAMQLIDSAEEWLTITCQFFPNSVTAQHLQKAVKRGVKVKIVYSHPRHHGFIGGLGQQASILRERMRVPKSMFSHGLGRDDPMLHAKLIACDKGVMVGSHNYVRAGVILGTAEIAFKCTDATLSKGAVETLDRGLKQS